MNSSVSKTVADNHCYRHITHSYNISALFQTALILCISMLNQCVIQTINIHELSLINVVTSWLAHLLSPQSKSCSAPLHSCLLQHSVFKLWFTFLYFLPLHVPLRDLTTCLIALKACFRFCCQFQEDGGRGLEFPKRPRRAQTVACYLSFWFI